MSNLIHKRGADTAIGKAGKIAKIEASDDICHPYKEIKGKKISLMKTVLWCCACLICHTLV